jgi:hypothetical protein
MKSPLIPEQDQLRAMLDGSVYELARRYVAKPSRYDLKKYLSINRRQLVDFLVANPAKAEAYFDRQKQSQATHDVERIWKEGTEHFVASMDHGAVRSIRRFSSLAEAVAEHVLVSYGMY